MHEFDGQTPEDGWYHVMHSVSSVTQMLKELGWESLADRSRQLRLGLLYKIINHLVAVSVDSILIPADPWTRANHQFKYKHIQVNTTVFRNSFVVATIPSRNSFQAETVKSATVTTFKSRLKTDWRQ